jgi:hypothetical protein
MQRASKGGDWQRKATADRHAGDELELLDWRDAGKRTGHGGSDFGTSWATL